MEPTQALKLAGVYTALWAVATVVGLAVAGVGVALGGLAYAGLRFASPVVIAGAGFPIAGLLLIVLGVLVWQFGGTAAFIAIFAAAVEAETAERLNTESMKSDILSVLDDRLADMHQELTQTRRLVDRLSRDEAASEFEFDDELEG